MVWNIIHVRKHVCTCWWIVTPQTSKVNIIWRQRNSNLSVWCHVTICVLEWRSLQISISKESPGEISREIWRISFLPGYYALHLPNHQYGWQIEAPENCGIFLKMGRLPQCWLSTRRTLVNCRGSRRWELGKCTSLPSTSETPRRNCSQYCRLQIKATKMLTTGLKWG